MFNGRNYSPTELLDLCKVDRFAHTDHRYFVEEILTVVVLSKSTEELRGKLSGLVYKIGKVSIGQSLDRLHSISTMGNECQGGLDGLDALCYHLSGDACKKGIVALQKVLGRFSEDEKTP